MKVIIKEPNKNAYVKQIEGTLEEYKKIVGGYIEVVPFGLEHLIILDEEGKFKGYEPNIYWQDDIIVGTLILVRDDQPDFASITDEEEVQIIQLLNRASV